MLPFCGSHSDADTALLWLTSAGREKRRDVHVCIWGMTRGDMMRGDVTRGGCFCERYLILLQLLIQLPLPLLPRIFLPSNHYYHPYYPTRATSLLHIMLLRRTMTHIEKGDEISGWVGDERVMSVYMPSSIITLLLLLPQCRSKELWYKLSGETTQTME